ncbi:hypothetical protein SAMN05216551_107187 [Chitinasiproducens palmae]|uniref:Uncharacterized protein n=1 Tax=Chitinasiproducens palmae TaxID=1770053 RepID=A0A1H2PQX1_9BURK|nr:hypothetical protein SAMN05216551_107187 [Chitinasiproducens palmae]
MKIEVDLSETASVTPLPVKPKARAEDGPYLDRAPFKCAHVHGFTVDESLEQVTCRTCGERLNPMWVLSQLCNSETRWRQSREQYQDEMKRLKERSRTKCEHCGKMTRISNR